LSSNFVNGNIYNLLLDLFAESINTLILISCMDTNVQVLLLTMIFSTHTTKDWKLQENKHFSQT